MTASHVGEKGQEYERHVTRRCPRMREHGIWRNGEKVLPVPCEDCYSVESIWRPIPYEPDNTSKVRAVVTGQRGRT